MEKSNFSDLAMAISLQPLTPEGMSLIQICLLRCKFAGKQLKLMIDNLNGEIERVKVSSFMPFKVGYHEKREGN